MNGNVVSITSGKPQGLISKTLAWILHPSYSDADPLDWFAFVVLLLIVGLLWSKVVKQTLDATLEAAA
jgi:hypothetical protein